MMKKLLLTYLSLLLFFNIALSQLNINRSVFDVSCLKLNEHELIGKWEFYWQKLLTPQEIKNQRLQLHPQLLDVPANWTEIKKFNRYGYGTYHTKIILPEKNKLYALKLIDIFSAYYVWLNDSLYFKNGHIGTKRQEEIAKRGTQIITFFADKDTVDVVIQVSNFNHRNGGILKPPVIGYAQYITNRFLVKSISVFFIFGAFIIFAIYLLWFYSYTKKNLDALFLGMAILLAGIYTLFNDDFFITSIFPNISWELVHKINFLTNYGKILFLLAFFKTLLQTYVNKFWNNIAHITNILLITLILVVLFTPTRLFSRTLIFFIVLMAIAILYILIGYFQLLSKVNNKKQYLIPFLGIIIMTIFAINDILYEYHIINSFYISDFGLFIFVSSQAILISEKQIHVLHKAEKLTAYFKKIDKVKKHISITQFNTLIPLLKILKHHFQADVIMYFSIDDGHYYLKATIDKYREKEYERKIELNRSMNERSRILNDFLELAAHNEEAFIISDKNKLYGLIKKKFNLKFQSLLITTLSSKGRKFSIIYMERHNSYFTFSDQKMLSLISSHIAIIINNINIFKQLQNINLNLQKIVQKRTEKIEIRNKELEIRNIELDEKVEELRITAEIINAMNDEIKSQQEILEEKNKLLIKQTKSLEKQKTIIEELNKQIRESIQYALRIQNAILNSPHNLPLDHQHFIISQAHETVSGNFWWYSKVNDYEILAFGQSNSSGIPGAFLSLIAFSIMNEITYEYLFNKHFNDIQIETIEKLFHRKISVHLTDKKIYFSTIIHHPQQKLLKFSHKENFIYIINNQIQMLSPHSKSPNELIKLQKDTYILAFTNNFIKELINKNKIFKLEEIDTIIEQIKNLDSIENIRTFFENYLLGSQDLDILIIGLKFD